MSCQIKSTADITDVHSIRRHLFPADEQRGTENWLNHCEVSVSPIGDIIVIAHAKRLVALTGKWDSNLNKNQFVSNESNGYQDFNENITSVLCLPIVVQSQSSQVGCDWTCILVGFESGVVSFLTEDCKALLEEQIHNEPVMFLKCQSQHSPRPDICTDLKLEEIYLGYQNNICVLNGSHVFNTLRNCRSQLARGNAPQQSVEINSLSNNVKKWSYLDQSSVKDAAVVGLDLTNTFDHLLTASTCGGFDSKYRAMPPHNNLVMGVGSKPFTAFHYALEGGPQPVLSDVAKAVASKLKSALPAWLTGTKTLPEKSGAISIRPAEAMSCRFGLCDLRRVALNIILSPDKKLAAVSDILGRVILIDTHKGVALRIFKGYRDAQCVFIQVPDEKKHKTSSKTPLALFLVIYSPKKGTLEIFSAQQGTKISGFTAAKTSRLLYINYGLMGFQNASKSRYICQYTSVFIDSTGEIKEIVIPFHFALTEKNSKRARDLHLYKRLKQFIKSSDFDADKFPTEALNTCSELKTTEVKLQCLELLSHSKETEADVLLKCAEHFWNKLNNSESELDLDMKQLKLISENFIHLCNFYKFVSTEAEKDLDSLNGNSKEAETKHILSAKEMSNLQKLLDLNTINDSNSNNPKVTFERPSSFTLSEFITSFDITNPSCIALKPDLCEKKLFSVSEAIFQKYLISSYEPFELASFIRNNNLAPKSIFKLVLVYWVHRPSHTFINLENEMQNLSTVLYALSKEINEAEILVEYNCLSLFWTEIRDFLGDSSKPFSALMAAMLCKSVSHKIESEKELQQSGTSIDESSIEIWEKLSQETCQWTLLIGKLEDISLLNIILANKPICKKVLPKLSLEREIVSLKYVLEKGKGCVSEIVAQWLCTGGVSPDDILLNDLGKNNEEAASSSSLNVTKNDNEEPVFYHLNLIKQQFPYSLEPSKLLANMCWEYALAWQKNIQEITYLEASMKCLYQIPNLHIKTGLFNLVWNTHLKIIFESACKLINKVGKLPKERLCRQNTDLSDYQVTIFNEICNVFFDSMVEVLVESYNYEKPVLQYEALWENGGKPLVDLALLQDNINYDIVFLHYQLCLVSHLMTTFSIKHSKMMNNLFDSSVLSYFFSDFQQNCSINFHKTDSKVNASRLQFLIKVISASMDMLTITDGKVYSSEHITWMSKCVKLARFWNMDVDVLKRYQVAQMFSNGFDSLGIELLGTITEQQKIGPDLVSIAGKRLAKLLSSSKDLGEKMAAFSTTLTNYLDSLNGDWCAPSDLESTMLLITHCLRCLDEAQPEYKLACLMLESCSTLQDLN